MKSKISKVILVLIGIVQLLAGSWAASVVFADTTAPISTMGMMGMLGSLFHSVVLFASLTFRTHERRVITLLLLVWHIPEAVLIATFGMGVAQDQQLVGIVTHAGIAVLALVSWYFAKNEE